MAAAALHDPAALARASAEYARVTAAFESMAVRHFYGHWDVRRQNAGIVSDAFKAALSDVKHRLDRARIDDDDAPVSDFVGLTFEAGVEVGGSESSGSEADAQL